MSEEKISILIAAYNEKSNIGRAIESVSQVLPDAEIIVVNDGSTDQTLDKARHYESDLVKVFSSSHKGKGHAIKKAIQEASGTIMAQIDTDLQFPAQGLPMLIKPILNRQADIVFGSRYLNPSTIEKGSVSIIKRLASYVMARIISIICHQRYTDVFAGFKAWRAETIKDINIQEDGFAYEAEIAIKAKKYGYSVLEVPTVYKRRLSGKTKIKLIYHTLTISWQIIKLLFFTR